MKHKILSIITALMMLSAVALITGCNNLQGNKPNNSSSQGNNGNNQGNNGNNQGNNGNNQGNNGNNQGNQNALVGVWKLVKNSNSTFPNNNSDGGTEQPYICFTANGKLIWATKTTGSQNSDKNGLFRDDEISYEVLQDNKIKLIPGNNEPFTYTVIGDSLTMQDNSGAMVFEAAKVTSPTEAEIKAAPELPHNNGGNQGNNGGNQGNNGGNQGNNGGNQGNNGGNQASQQDLQGVWKVTAQGRYAMHILVEGTTVYAATNAAGPFVKVPSPFTYNSDGTIAVTGPGVAYNLTPVKNGDKIDLQLNGITAYTLIKDANVSADTIKNAQTIPQP